MARVHKPSQNDLLKQQYRINRQIRVPEVRVVGDNIESMVMSTRDALQMAERMQLDLVEISPNAAPPVCRITDFSKFIYQQKRRQKEMKAKQVKVEVKEIRFGPQTDEHDYEFKLKHAKSFLSAGDKVKAYVFFRGRSILFKEQGEVLLLRFANDLEEYGKVEQMPVLEGKRMILFIAPKKIAPKKDKEEVATESAILADVNLTGDEEKPTKKAPQQKAKKEYKGPFVEGEDF